jgi:hypothetical protein
MVSLFCPSALGSVKQLCCSGVLVGTKRMFGLVTALQIASASAASFFCPFDVRLDVGRKFTGPMMR